MAVSPTSSQSLDFSFMNRRNLFSISITILLFVSLPVYAQHSKEKRMPKEEVEKLMSELIPFAQKMLSEHGEFFPFGGVINSKGEIVHIGAYDGNEKPPSQKLIDLMVEGFRDKAKTGEYRATAILFDVKVQIPESNEKTDAIQINLDHIEDYSVEVFLPYKIEKSGIAYGNMFAQKGKSDIFKK